MEYSIAIKKAWVCARLVVNRSSKEQVVCIAPTLGCVCIC